LVKPGMHGEIGKMGNEKLVNGKWFEHMEMGILKER